MDKAPEPEPVESPYLKLPWPVVAGSLFAVLALALAAGLYANRYLRPQSSTQPTATQIPLASAGTATLQPTPAVTSSSGAQQSTQVAGAGATVQPPLLATAVPSTPQPAPTLGATSATAIPQASPTPTEVGTQTVAVGTTSTPAATPTVDPVLAAEIGRAYEAYWRVRSQAVLQLDPTHLADVMDGEHLAAIGDRIEEMRAEGKAIKTRVALNYTVVEASEVTASVVDRIEDNSYYVAPGTEQPLTEPAADVLLVMYRLQKISGVWKVVDSVRAP
jgi:hypothetical protein